MSMMPERVTASTKEGQTRRKAGEHPQTYLKRNQDERAKLDSVYDARLKSDKGGAFGTGSVGEESG